MGFMPANARNEENAAAAPVGSAQPTLVSGGGRDDGYAHYQFGDGRQKALGGQLNDPSLQNVKNNYSSGGDPFMRWLDSNPHERFRTAAFKQSPDGSWRFSTGSSALGGIPVSDLSDARFENGRVTIGDESVSVAEFNDMRAARDGAARSLEREYEVWKQQGAAYGYV